MFPVNPDFIGREAELTLLNNVYESQASGFIPVYGRRRIGKSELILQFMRNRPGVYFLGKKASSELMQKEFLEEAARVLQEPLLSEITPGGWLKVFKTLVGHWKERRKGAEKLILALDEFQWMVEVCPELPSILQQLWDLEWKREGQILLILCGSYLGFMEREVLGSKSPLFGRRTAQILLGPFNHGEGARFHPGLSPADLARVRFLVGGIPMYLRCFDDRLSVEQNIIRVILDEFGPLFREADFLLREELRELEKYYSILNVLALGADSPGVLAKAAGVKERSLFYYLQNMTQLGYVERFFPLDGEKPRRPSVRYRLADPLLRFYFRFVYPHTSYLGRRGAELTFKDCIAPTLESYYGYQFERLCGEVLGDIYEREGVMGAFEIGPYWNKDTQIDLVGLRGDNRADLAECRWGGRISPGALEKELELKRKRFPNPRGDSLSLRVFVRKTPPNARKSDKLIWHDLSDIYPEL